MGNGCLSGPVKGNRRQTSKQSGLTPNQTDPSAPKTVFEPKDTVKKDEGHAARRREQSHFAKAHQNSAVQGNSSAISFKSAGKWKKKNVSVKIRGKERGIWGKNMFKKTKRKKFTGAKAKTLVTLNVRHQMPDRRSRRNGCATWEQLTKNRPGPCKRRLLQKEKEASIGGEKEKRLDI